MRACITGGLALLFLCVSGVHAQQPSRLQVGTPVRATLAADGTITVVESGPPLDRSAKISSSDAPQTRSQQLRTSAK